MHSATSGLARTGIFPFDHRVSAQIYDAIIIGGGPGGSTVATYLARAGKRVLVLEKEHFPRFHVGESLLPYNHEIFREMGVLPELLAAGFPKKFGAQFHLGNGRKSIKLTFRNGRYTRETEAIQAERSKFDDILLKHTRACGAEVREGWTVTKFSRTPDNVAISAREENGQSETFSGKFLIDASGRGNFTGNQEGLRVVHPKLKKLSIFGHFEGVKLDEGEKGGDTVIIRLANKWFWFIPISATKTSVGCVMNQAEFSQAGKEAEAIFNSVVQISPALRERMADARRVGDLQVTGDFSYYNRRLVGPRLIRVGDAAGFLDPIFSTGVFLAMKSGKRAADRVLASLAAGDDGARRFKAYERRTFRDLNFFQEMVEGYYTTPFMEVFLEPREKWNLPAAIVALLAGELEGGWKLYWRRKLFFLLVKIQSRRPFLPRIRFN